MKLSEVDLNLLVILDAIIRERSVTGAGRVVGLSQPAVSASLRRLRELLGDPLIERVGAQSRLTPLALTLEEPLQQILASIENALNRRTGFDPSTSQRMFRIAASDDIATVFLQPLLLRLRKLAPRISLQVQRPDKDTPQQLAARQIELAIEPEDRYRKRDFASQRLFTDRLMVAIWSGNTAVGDSITRDQFFQLGHVTYSMKPYTFTLADRCLGTLAQNLNLQVVTDSFISLAMLLRGTDLLALVPERLAVKVQQAAQIRLLRPPFNLSEFHICMAWPALFEQDAAHVWLRSVMADLGKHLEPVRVVSA
ncbi:MAG TPA: LysR family transcriptional regulator [Polyangiales bacterium]|nr:LysR family transcriptional regulator [Polyangiales bacterium]